MRQIQPYAWPGNGDRAGEREGDRKIQVHIVGTGKPERPFTLSSGAEGTYAGRWCYVSTVGLAGADLAFLFIGIVRKARLDRRWGKPVPSGQGQPFGFPRLIDGGYSPES